jgi:alpha-beta hydrolase superfamily lysophospholipase
MTQPNQTSLAALRQSLPEFSHAGQLGEPLRTFCRFYNIDFERRMDGVQHRAGYIESGEFSLAVHRWTIPGASKNLLLVHGYMDHVGLFGHLVEYGLKHGCNVVAFDLPGHGLSSGEFVVIEDFAHYSQAVADVIAGVVLPELPRWVIAQSTGCAALMDFALKNPWPFTDTVFLAPLIRPAAWGRMRTAYLLLHRFKDTISRTFTANSSDQHFLAFAMIDPLQSRYISVRWVGALRRWLAGLEFKDLGVGPVLVLQGDADGTVAWRYNMRRIMSLFPNSQIEYLPGAGHQLANESVEFRARYLKIIDRYLKEQAQAPGIIAAD